MLRHVVVVGASLAGLRAVETLRTAGYDGGVTLVGAEPHLPYDRPPLSKKVLAGDWEPDRIALRKPAEYHDLAIDLRLGVRATGLDTKARTVLLADGHRLPYDGLVVATGAAPRRLPGLDGLQGVFELRTLDDSLALRDALADTRRVVVVGAGFIGLEVAATARQRGAEVTVVDVLPAPLVRGLGPEMGQAVADVHRDHGVDLRLGVGLDAVGGSGRVERVRLTDGTSLDADVLVVGVGVAPNTSWLEGSGITLRDGVVCDAYLATGAPGVYAAGDVARWPHPLLGEEVRIEHWTNAAEQGAAAARNLLEASSGGEGSPYAAVPFFWSDQFEARVQFLGRAGDGDRAEVVLGEQSERRFVACYARGDRLTAVLGVSMPRALMSFRRLLADGATLDDARDHAISLM